MDLYAAQSPWTDLVVGLSALAFIAGFIRYTLRMMSLEEQRARRDR